MSRSLGLEIEVAGKWIAFWAGLHDLGKASPAFQARWDQARILLNERGLKCLPVRDVIPHGFITAIVVEQLLGDLGLSISLAQTLARILGGHHGVFPRLGDLNRVSGEAQGKGPWKILRQELFEEMAKHYQIGKLHLPCGKPGAPFFLALAGLVTVADWIGSNEVFFPYAGNDQKVSGYLEGLPGKARRALSELGWLGWRSPAEPKSLPQLFPVIAKHGVRPLQQAVAELAGSLKDPCLVIIEAPMGEGKTEAAMYLADHWAMVLQQGGCYFALPTMATSNQMFGRVQEFLSRRYPKDLVNIQLLHGHAALTAEFQALKEKTAKLFTPSHLETEGEPEGDVIAAEWFTHRKRGLLAPFGVGTVDQALLAVLQTRHFFVRLYGLCHKTVIVDEVHAYDAYMSHLLKRLLEWLAALGCPVVLLSATLPGAKRRVLLEAYQRGLGVNALEALHAETPYPRLTWVDASGAGALPVAASPQFARSIRFNWAGGQASSGSGDWCELGVKLKEALAGGGCAAVICNTVGRAQEIYRALQEYFPKVDRTDGLPELALFHARFLFADRERREQEALRRFGKPGGQVHTDGGQYSEVKRPHRAVLVATQVIEQSLDLDFDLMVTEIAPVDLVLQRAGGAPGVVPTHVGVNRNQQQLAGKSLRSPHARGGEPASISRSRRMRPAKNMAG